MSTLNIGTKSQYIANRPATDKAADNSSAVKGRKPLQPSTNSGLNFKSECNHSNSPFNPSTTWLINGVIVCNHCWAVIRLLIFGTLLAILPVITKQVTAISSYSNAPVSTITFADALYNNYIDPYDDAFIQAMPFTDDPFQPSGFFTQVFAPAYHIYGGMLNVATTTMVSNAAYQWGVQTTPPDTSYNFISGTIAGYDEVWTGNQAAGNFTTNRRWLILEPMSSTGTQGPGYPGYVSSGSFSTFPGYGGCTWVNSYALPGVFSTYMNSLSNSATNCSYSACPVGSSIRQSKFAPFTTFPSGTAADIHMANGPNVPPVVLYSEVGACFQTVSTTTTCHYASSVNTVPVSIPPSGRISWTPATNCPMIVVETRIIDTNLQSGLTFLNLTSVFETNPNVGAFSTPGSNGLSFVKLDYTTETAVANELATNSTVFIETAPNIPSFFLPQVRISDITVPLNHPMPVTGTVNLNGSISINGSSIMINSTTSGNVTITNFPSIQDVAIIDSDDVEDHLLLLEAMSKFYTGSRAGPGSGQIGKGLRRWLRKNKLDTKSPICQSGQVDNEEGEPDIQPSVPRRAKTRFQRWAKRNYNVDSPFKTRDQLERWCLLMNQLPFALDLSDEGVEPNPGPPVKASASGSGGPASSNNNNNSDAFTVVSYNAFQIGATAIHSPLQLAAQSVPITADEVHQVVMGSLQTDRNQNEVICNNYYAILRTLGEEGVPDVNRTGEYTKLHDAETKAVSNRKSKYKRDDSKGKTSEQKQEDKDSELDEALIKNKTQLMAVWKRFDAKIKTARDLMTYILVNSPRPGWVEYLYDRKRYDFDPNDTAALWFIHCRIWEVSRQDEFDGYSACVGALSLAIKSPAWAEWYARYFDLPPPDTPEVQWSISSKRRNHAVYSEQGNDTSICCATFSLANLSMYVKDLTTEGVEPNPGPPIIAATMEDILGSPHTDSLESQSQSVSPLQPVDALARVSGVAGPEGIASALTTGQDHFRGTIVTAANTLVSPAALDAPESMLCPRSVRIGAASPLVGAIQFLTWYAIGTTNWNSRPVAATAESLALVATMMEGRMRMDSINSDGYRGPDKVALYELVRKGSIAGDSMLLPFIKLHLYTLILSWSAPNQLLPLGMIAGKNDSYTQLDPALVTNLTYNDNAIPTAGFGENAGGAASFFPWGGGDPTLAGAAAACGKISFHQSLDSIPASERSNTLAMKTADLLATESGNPAVNYVLSALMMARFPCGFFRFNLNTLDSVGTNPATQAYIPWANAIRTNGLNTLRHLVPIINCANPPVDQNSANVNLVVPPSTGPTASNLYPANTPLNLSYANGTGTVLQEYSLAEWLYTWLGGNNPIIDATTIQRFAIQLAQTTGRHSDYWAALEIAMVLANRYPIMASTVANTPLQYAGNSVGAIATQNYAGLKPGSATNAYPMADPSKWDYVIPGISALWITSIATGIVTTAPLGDIKYGENCDIVGSPQLVQYSRYATRMYAAGMQAFFCQTQFPAVVWNSLFTQTNFPGIRDKYRDLWINPSSYANDQKHLIAPLGLHVRTLTAAVTNYKCALDGFGRSLHSYMNAPQGGFWGVYNNAVAELTTVTSCILPDIWFYLTSKVVSSGMQAFLVPLERMSGILNPSEKIAAFGAGLKSTPIPPEAMALNIGTNEEPVTSDSSFFNKRLAFHLAANAGGGGAMYTTDGIAVAAGTVPFGNLVTQRFCIKDASMSAAATYANTRLATACTFWIPSININGQNLIVAVTDARGSNVMTQVMAGVTYAAAETYLFPHKPIMPNLIIGGKKTSEGKKYLTEAATSAESLNSSSSSPASVPGAYHHIPNPSVKQHPVLAAAAVPVIAAAAAPGAAL